MGVLLLLALVLSAGGRLEASSQVPKRGFMDHLMSMNGCGRFAGLVNATANATRIFQRSLAHGGLMVFCPDDEAVAAFEPAFNDVGADCQCQLAVLLYHGVAAASLKDRRPTKTLTMPTLATDLADGGYGLIRGGGDAMELWSSSGGVATVTRMVTGEEEPLVVFLIDDVLLPRESIECIDCRDISCPHWADVVAAARVLAEILICLAAAVVFMAIILLGVFIYSVVLLSLRARAVHPLP